MPSFLPYGKQSIAEDDIEEVVKVLRSDWLTTGPAVERFEEALKEKVDAAYAVSCSSGTAALHLAVLAAGIGEGDIVIVPAITFIATANAVRYVGGEVVFSDVNPENGLMEGQHLQEAIARVKQKGKKVKAIIQVHLNGQCADLKEMYAIAQKENCILIDDACHAIGTVYGEGGKEYKIGCNAFSDFTVFSFHPVKTVTMGEGGAITTNNKTAAAHMKKLRSHGVVKGENATYVYKDLAYTDGQYNPWYYELQELGYNYRATDIQCALGYSQLQKLGAFVKKRQELVEAYDKLITPLGPEVRPIQKNPFCKAAWHLYPVLIDFGRMGKNRLEVIRGLLKNGIGSQVHYLPVYRQPYYQQIDTSLRLKHADHYYASILSLPLYSALTHENIEYIVNSLTILVNHENSNTAYRNAYPA